MKPSPTIFCLGLVGLLAVPKLAIAQCTICFNPAVNYAVGSNPYGVATADFNGDGFADLAVNNWGSSTVSILLGTGTGTFGAATNFTVNTNPRAIVTADFNNDGKADFATCNDGVPSVSVRLGDGLGGFAAMVNYAVAAAPECLVRADFNGDSNADLATANYGSLNTSILLGTGTGTFGAATNYSTGAGSFPYGICTGDFNLDTRADLVTVSYSASNLSRLSGNGTGGFAAPVSYGTGSTGSYSVCAADFTSDGRPDIVLANANTNNISRLTTSGTGTFGAATTYAAGSFPFCVIPKDFNLDSKNDVAVANYSSNNVSLLMGMGTGAFCAAVNFAAGSSPTSLASADFNGDGLPDLAASNNNSNNVSVFLNCTAVLPVEILHFGCMSQGNEAPLLTWQTSELMEGCSFQLERSADGDAYVPVSVLEAQPSLREYAFLDPLALGQEVTYRLTLRDANGGSQHAETVACRSGHTQAANVRVFDLHGRLLASFVSQEPLKQLGDMALPAGILLVELTQGDEVTYLRHLHSSTW